MRRRLRRSEWTAFVALLGLISCGSDGERPVSTTARASWKGTPVVLIVIDTMRKDHLSCYGNPRPTSPHIDRLAQEGVRFDRAYSQAPWTTPSIGALLSSQYPTSLGILDERSRIPQEVVLLAEVFRKANVATSAVVSHSFCSRRWGFAQGFDHFDQSNVLGHNEVVSAGVSDRAIEQLEELSERPFFLFLHYFDPHFAYIEHADFPFRETEESYQGPVRSGMKFTRLLKLKRRLRDVDLVELLRIYDSETAWTDCQIGRVLEHLREEDLYDRSLIILTADHGEEFLDHSNLGHTKTLYDELVNVPLIVKYPVGFPAETPLAQQPSVIQSPVGLVDLYPTILDVVELPLEHAIRGQSFLEAGRDERLSPRPIFLETSKGNRRRAVVLGRHKLVVDLDNDQSWLFDLAADPAEKVNLRNTEPETTALLRQKLDQWLATNVAGEFEVETQLDLSEEERERLLEMGYLQDG